MKIITKCYNIEQIFHKIYERLVTNKWKFDIYYGETSIIQKFFENISETEKYDYSEDELWIENSPNLKLPSNFIFSPILVACLKKEPGIDYGELTIETSIEKRKDITQSIIGKKGQSLEDLKLKIFPANGNLSVDDMIQKWFLMRLQFFIDQKIGKNSKLTHVSSSEITLLSEDMRNAVLCRTIRLHSVWAYALAEKIFSSECQIIDGKMFLSEEANIPEEKIQSALTLIEISLNFDNQNFVAWHLKGLLLYKMKNFEEAEKCFSSSSIINSGWNDSIFYEGKMLILRGFPYQGLRKIEQAIEKEPNKISFIVFRANVLQALEKHDDAIKEYERAVLLFEKSKNYPISYLHFILYSQFISLQKLNRITESSIILEKIRTIFENDKISNSLKNSSTTLEKINPKQILQIEDEIENDIKDFVLTKDTKENIRKLIEILKKLEEFLYWSDQYFSQKGFEWIKEACLGNNSIKDVRILSGIGKKDEILARPFKRKIDRLKVFLNEIKIDFQFRIAADKELVKRHHGRFIISKNVILNVPSINNFTANTLDVVSKIDITREDTEFDEWWNKSVDFLEYRKNEKEKANDLE